MKGIQPDGRCNIPRHACAWCRNHPGTGGFPLNCPHGYEKHRLPILLGNVVEKALRPIARALGLTGCRGCAARKDKLNRVRVR